MELEGKRVAVLVEDEYADLELWYLRCDYVKPERK